MIKRFLILLLCTALVPGTSVADLPDLGDVAASELSPLAERRLGESIMREIRWRDPSYLDDPEVEDYLNRIGRRLVAGSDQPNRRFEFFVIDDPTLNAFALPGGHIGVHSGLILAAESESELAAVLGHEIAHVTQRHIAQLFGKQGQASMVMLASLLVAILAAKSNSQVSEAALAAGQAGVIQSQLGYTRAFEREADRIGLQIMERSGFDVRGKPSFFERLQRSSRLYENNAPGYLRSHPLTEERISDISNRVAQMRYRQVPDSADFRFIQAKLRASVGSAVDRVRDYETSIAGGAADPAAQYALARALLRAGRVDGAWEATEALRTSGQSSPFIEALAAETRLAARDPDRAIAIMEKAVATFPDHASLQYILIEALIRGGRAADAAALSRAALQRNGDDVRLWALSSRAEETLGRMSAYHRAQAEVYAIRGSLPAAIEQLELARRAGDGDFFELSAIDARMRELQEEARQRRAEEGR
jgi:beta-barrel assembly-enhancing protease